MTRFYMYWCSSNILHIYSSRWFQNVLFSVSSTVRLFVVSWRYSSGLINCMAIVLGSQFRPPTHVSKHWLWIAFIIVGWKWRLTPFFTRPAENSTDGFGAFRADYYVLKSHLDPAPFRHTRTSIWHTDIRKVNIGLCHLQNGSCHFSP